MPSIASFPAGQQVPWPNSVGVTGIIDFSIQMGGISGAASHRDPLGYSGAFLDLSNDSDSTLFFHFNNSGAEFSMAPGDAGTIPIKTDDTQIIWRIQSQNPQQVHPLEQIVAVFLSPADIAAGWQLYKGNGVNPNVRGAPRGWYDITSYGATTLSDAFPAFQAAINAAQAAIDAGVENGAIIYVPPFGPFTMLTGVIIARDNIEVWGGGWGSQLLAGATNITLITFQLPGGGAGTFRYGAGVRDLFINGAGNAGVNGIDLQGTYGALLDHVRIRFCNGIGVHWNGGAGQFGAYNKMRACHISDSTGVAVQTDSSEWLVMESTHVGFHNNAGVGIGLKLQNLNCVIAHNQFDHNDTAIDLEFAGRSAITANQFDRGAVNHIKMRGNKGCIVSHNLFAPDNQTTGVNIIAVADVGTTGNVISDNVVAAGSLWTNFINETSIPNAPGNLYADNETAGLPIIRNGTNSRSHDNRGYNPVGLLVAPAVPATTVAAINTFGVDVTVYVTGGTVTAVAINGTATGQIAGTFDLHPNDTIAITYTVVPTWVWFGN